MDADVIVVGGGSNTLSAAAYLGKAGLGVCVLEKNDRLGGCVVSHDNPEGYIQDTIATAIVTGAANPIIADDELDLFSRHGLEIAWSDKPYATIFEDGSGLITYRDLDASCESIARFSTRDAEAYRALVGEALAIWPILRQALFEPPVPYGSFIAGLDSTEQGRHLLSLYHSSIYDIVRQRFENDAVRTHLARCPETAQSADTNGTGLVLYLFLALAHSYPTGAVVGGLQKLSDALGACLEQHGGSIRYGVTVDKILVEGGRAVGVLTSDGETIRARRAVVASIHPWDLGSMVPGVSEALVQRCASVRLSQYGSFNIHCTLPTTPSYHAGTAFDDAMNVCLLDRDPKTFLRNHSGYRYGDMPTELDPIIYIQSNFDPTRAPEGHATLYAYNFVPFEPAGATWDDIKSEFADRVLAKIFAHMSNLDIDQILSRTVVTPADHAAWSPSLKNGDTVGIAMDAGQMFGMRPIPELANYRVPGAEGLYLCGPFMHPGGTIILGGRATALQMFADMGLEREGVFIG
ncbi:Phytoene dehydrogenase-related protein [Sphingobium faniae]|nr:Phytoene dehydrogenase-related protein [Sphingobium faniae]